MNKKQEQDLVAQELGYLANAVSDVLKKAGYDEDSDLQVAVSGTIGEYGGHICKIVCGGDNADAFKMIQTTMKIISRQ